MESHRALQRQWKELESLRQIHTSNLSNSTHLHYNTSPRFDRKETGSTSEAEDIKSAYSAPGALAMPAGSSSLGATGDERRERARMSELGPRLAGYLEMNPLFLIRRDDRNAGGGNSNRAGSPEVVIIPLSPNSVPSPRLPEPRRRFNCCRNRRGAFIVPGFVLVNVVVFFVTMYRNNCPAHQNGYRCILPGLKRFSFQPLSQNPLLGPSAETLLGMGALESELIIAGGEGWRLITCMWLHAGVFHLLLNMLGLLTLGLQMEQEFGLIKIGLIYLLSGFGGSILSALFLRLTISVGASGALFGLMGALLSELLINWSRHERNWFLLSQLLVLLIINLALGKMPHVDNYAHFGGCIGGFLLGFILLQKPHFTWPNEDQTIITGSPPPPAQGIPAHEFTPTAPGISESSQQLVQFDPHQQQQVVDPEQVRRQQLVLLQHQQRQRQIQQPWRISTCVVSLPKYKFVIWILALNLFVVLYVVALIMLFRGVDVRKKCRWCRQIM